MILPVSLLSSIIAAGTALILFISPTSVLEQAVPNDNRVAGGHIGTGALALSLEARWAGWRPDAGVDSAVTVMAFAEPGGPPRIPAPLLRAEQGTDIRVRIRNTFVDSTLTVHGLRAGTVGTDTVHIPPGATREIRYTAGQPGTYLYWGTTGQHAGPDRRQGRDGQLTGAIVIDPRGTKPDPRERIFVMTVIDIVPDTTRPGAVEDIWELAINGRSWPHTERMEYAVGDTVHWRWLNGSYLPHPMHLHGFHFRVLSKGSGVHDSAFAAGDVRHVVTELMQAGSTFTMDWVPTRAGNWLMHCHMAPHISPFPERPDSMRAHDGHDVAQHALTGMAGLVLGITTFNRGAGPPVVPEPAQRLRLLIQQSKPDSTGKRAYGYEMATGDAARDSVRIPGPPLLLTRGTTTAITVVNNTDQPTTVHWHGMELESFYDGVAGWSGAAGALAPLIVRGDSFTVAFTPPRAGTFIYHTHMDETAQLSSGSYGPLIVLEPAQRYDPETDLVFIAGGVLKHGRTQAALNGSTDPPELVLRSGSTYRLRFINILPADAVALRLVNGDVPLQWRPVAKDGSDLPASLRQMGVATVRRIGVGETYDFEWTPAHPGRADLVVDVQQGADARAGLVQRFVVR